MIEDNTDQLFEEPDPEATGDELQSWRELARQFPGGAQLIQVEDPDAQLYKQ